MPFSRFRLLTQFITWMLVVILVIPVQAQSVLELPSPGMMVTRSPQFIPPVLKGMSVNLDNPFEFDFILDHGQTNLTPTELKEEAEKLIRYFLVSLALPEQDLWVNLSPYEHDRIIDPQFAATEMGRDLLAQDYMLKQITSTLIYPEEELGQEFWDRVYSRLQERYGMSTVPFNTFNKVWIVPDKAVVYEESDTANGAFILESSLKVMLEKDYIALSNGGLDDAADVQDEILKDVIIPELEQEVNHGKHFAPLRQIYHSLILATWYKERLRTSLLNQVYADQKKTSGIDVIDESVKEQIYQKYLEAFKTGVFDYIKEEYDILTQELIPRKYFSGGTDLDVDLQTSNDAAAFAAAQGLSKLSRIAGVYGIPKLATPDPELDWDFPSSRTFLLTSQLLNYYNQAQQLIEHHYEERRKDGIELMGFLIGRDMMEQELFDQLKIIPTLVNMLNDRNTIAANAAYRELRNAIKEDSVYTEQILDEIARQMNKFNAYGRGQAVAVVGEVFKKGDDFFERTSRVIVNALSDQGFVASKAIQAVHEAFKEEVIDFNHESIQVILDQKKKSVEIGDHIDYDFAIVRLLVSLASKIKKKDQRIVDIALKAIQVVPHKSVDNQAVTVRYEAAEIFNILYGERLDPGQEIIDVLMTLIDDEKFTNRAFDVLSSAVFYGFDIGERALKKITIELLQANPKSKRDVSHVIRSAYRHGLKLPEELDLDWIFDEFETRDNRWSREGFLNTAIEMILRGGAKEEKYLERLLTLLESTHDEDIPGEIFMALAKLQWKKGPVGKKARETLKAGLDDPDAQKRRSAFIVYDYYIEQKIKLNKTLVKKLFDPLDDPEEDPEIRERAVAIINYALRQGQRFSERNMDRLFKVYNDFDSFDNWGRNTLKLAFTAIMKADDTEDKRYIKRVMRLFYKTRDEQDEQEGMTTRREMLGKAIEDAIEQEVDIGDEQMKKVLKIWKKDKGNTVAFEILREAVKRGQHIQWGFIKAVIDSIDESAENTDEIKYSIPIDVLDEAVDHGVDIGKRGVQKLKFIMQVDTYEYSRASRVLANVVLKGGPPGQLALQALIDTVEPSMALSANDAIDGLYVVARDGGDIGPEGFAALEEVVQQGIFNRQAYPVEALTFSLNHGHVLQEKTLLKLYLARLGFEAHRQKDEAQSALYVAKELDQLPIFSLAEIKSIDDALTQMDGEVLSSEEENVQIALSLNIRTIVNNEIKKEDVRYLTKLIRATKNIIYLEMMLDVMRRWSLRGSSSAQNFLEARIEQIVQRPQDGKEFVPISAEDELYIDAVAVSYRQRTLEPIFLDPKFSMDIRIKVMKILAEVSYIDSAYSESEYLALYEKRDEKDMKRLLGWVTRVHNEFGVIPPLKLANRLLNGQTSLAKLRETKTSINKLLEEKDHRVLIRKLAKFPNMRFVYYALYPPPFYYQGIGVLSYERFEKLIASANDYLDKNRPEVVEGQLYEAFVRSGWSEDEAKQIIQRLSRGGPPLPDNSPYLDENGDFIPQKVDVLAFMNELDGSDEARKVFTDARDRIVLLLKINDLKRRIKKGIYKRFMGQPAERRNILEQLNTLVDGVTFDSDLEQVYAEIRAIHDQVFPLEGRKRDVDEMMATTINNAIKNHPMFKWMFDEEKIKDLDAQTIILEHLEIEHLLRNIDKMVNKLKQKQEQKRLDWIEERVIKKQKVDRGHVMEIFLGQLMAQLKFELTSSVRKTGLGLVSDLWAGVSYFITAVTEHGNLDDIPKFVYLDFPAKHNLNERIAVANGAHCCLSSDQGAAAPFLGGEDIFLRELPMHIANDTFFHWQFSTEPRGGRQFGWYENWFGLDEDIQQKVMIGTEPTYLAPTFQNRLVQKALMAKVEEVLFSLRITKIANGFFDTHPVNSMPPTADYKPQRISLTKLQSLELPPKQEILEDAQLPVNQVVHRDLKIVTDFTEGFYVKENPNQSVQRSEAAPAQKTISVPKMKILTAEEITPALVDRLLEIETDAFGSGALGREYMESHVYNPNVVIFTLTDESTGQIVGYAHAVPAQDAELLNALSEEHQKKYEPYRDGTLYQSDLALMRKYWRRAKMRDNFPPFLQHVKQLGYKYITAHNRHRGGLVPLSILGFEQKWVEPHWGGVGKPYDFLVLDLSEIDGGSQTSGGIDFTAGLLELEIRGKELELNISPEDIQDSSVAVRGLVPVILKIQPVTNFPYIFAN